MSESPSTVDQKGVPSGSTNDSTTPADSKKQADKE